MAQWVKNPPAMQETQEMWVRSIGQEDPPEEEMATHSSILAPKIPWTGESDRLQSKGSQRVGHDWATKQASKQANIFKYSCCCSFAQLCTILCDPMDYSTPVFPVLPWVCSKSCPLSWWCHPTISCSVTPVSFCLQSFPEWGSFPMIQPFPSGSQSIRASASVLPMNIQGWYSLDWLFDLLAVQGTLKSLLQHRSSKAPILQCSAFFMVQLSYPYMTIGKAIGLTRWIFVGRNDVSAF